jgi:GAF domain-containing protein
LPANILADIDLVVGIPAVTSILDIVCWTTGMGFAAVARVTPDKWVACATKDDIGFGLKPGGELQVETTICHEIRQDPVPVIIENVDEDAFYCRHHTPAKYGFKSYVSFPVILPDGTFFGTLCAIDPSPRILNTPEITGTFKLFAELIAYHLDFVRKLAETERLLEERREADRRQRVLQRELSHRMKNTLAMVQAVVSQSGADGDGANPGAGSRTGHAYRDKLGKCRHRRNHRCCHRPSYRRWSTLCRKRAKRRDYCPTVDGIGFGHR